MNRFLTACALTIALLAAMPALAFETPVDSDKGKKILGKMGSDMAPVATRLGAPYFVWADFTEEGRAAALVYTPSEKNFKKSTRKVSMVVYALPGKADEDKKIMTAAAQALTAGYKKNAKIIKHDVFHNPQGEPGLFIEYTMGEGDAKEHSSGVFVRLTPFTASFIQLQSRVSASTAKGASDAGKKG
jgi:hypothetical protein